MCFLKIGDPLSPCDHEECKRTLQAIQLSSCLYNTQTKPSNAILKPQPQYVPKRPRPEGSAENGNNPEESLVKKIKTDSLSNDDNVPNVEKKEDISSHQQTSDDNNFMKLLAMQQQQNKPMVQSTMSNNYITLKPPMQSQGMPLMAPQNNDSQQLLTYLLMQNTQNNKPVNQMQNQMQNVYHDVGQSMQDPMLNIQLQMNALHNPGNNGQNNMNGGNNLFDNGQQNNQSVVLSKDFLNKIYTIITMQHKLITEIKDKNNQLYDGFNKLTQEFIDFKGQIIKMNQTEEPSHYPLQPKVELNKAKLQMAQIPAVSPQFNIIGVPGETITPRDLLHYLYAHKQEKFQYKLIQSTELDSTLYRERNFSFSVSLVDFNDQPIANTNRIPLSVAIYTYENPPKCLDTNTSGNKILKGNIEKDLVNGYCSFEKIQIKEVTSHFRKGYVFLVIYPKMPTFGNISSGSIQQNFIDFTTIKPLIIEKVVVKAKKINACKNLDSSHTHNGMNENECIKDEDESEDSHENVKERAEKCCSNAE